MNPDLVAPIGVEVEHLSRELLIAAQLPLGVSETQPHRLTQMREIKSAEHAMPRCVVALCAANCAPHIFRITTATAKRGQRHHFLVCPVRLRILGEKVSPMPAANECTILTGDA